MKKEKYLYDGFHKIIEVEAEMNGKKVKRERLLLKSAVGGIVIDENNRIGLVVQYRPTIEQMTREIPAGVLDKPGLTPLQTLIEELEEECQIKPEDILSINEEPFQEYYMVTGSSNAKMSIYEIQVKAQSNKAVDDVDVESVEWVDLETFEEYVKNGSIVDGKTLISYYYLKSKLNK